MAARALLRPKDEAGSPKRMKRAEANELQTHDSVDCYSLTDCGNDESGSEYERGEILEDELRSFCQECFNRCHVYVEIGSSSGSDSSYVPDVLRKALKKSGNTENPKSRSKDRKRKSSRRGNLQRISKQSSNHDSRSNTKRDIVSVSRTKKVIPLKEESTIQRSAASKSLEKFRDDGRQRSLPGTFFSSKTLIPAATNSSKSRKSVVEILLDPTLDQKEADRIVSEMHKQAKDNRVDELEGYLDEVRKAIRALDIQEGLIDEDDDDLANLSPDLDSSNDEEGEPGKMDAQAMRTMLTALAGREAKEDAVASVANIGSSWRTIPHDQLNCCLSMDPKLLGDHRQRVKKNYDEFDRVFQPRKESDFKPMGLPSDENEEITGTRSKEPNPGRPADSNHGVKREDPVNVAELTREQMLEIHDKIGPWVHHHTKKLDKLIQSRKNTPQYLLNHWNGELSDDDSEVDFEKHRSAWKKKLEDRENPSDQESQAPTKPEDNVPTLEENNWFLFPTPMTRSYSTDTDEQGWDGQRTRPFSQVAMEGLVKYLKRQQEVEKSRKFLRENPWPPQNRYPPKVTSELEVKYVGRDVPEEEEDRSDIRVPN